MSPLAVNAGVVGDEADALALEEVEVAGGEDVEAGEDLGRCPLFQAPPARERGAGG